jgi:hypothetical protein
MLFLLGHPKAANRGIKQKALNQNPEMQKPAFAGFWESHQILQSAALNWCPEEDSNFHDLAVTST